MQGIPWCRFVNKRIDWEPKCGISECSPTFGKVCRQTRANYNYQKMASWRVYLLFLSHTGCSWVFCVILSVFLMQNWFLLAFTPCHAPPFWLRVWRSWGVLCAPACFPSHNFLFLLQARTESLDLTLLFTAFTFNTSWQNFLRKSRCCFFLRMWRASLNISR